MARDETTVNATSPEPSTRAGVILVVDDHELIRNSLAQVLLREFTGSRVVEAVGKGAREGVDRHW